jgi:NTE family protein
MSMATLVNRSAASLSRPSTALVLMGGGARTAYQVGVLKGLMGVLGLQPGPSAAWSKALFPVLVGTSAGAINASFLAGHASDWPRGVARLEGFWRELRSQAVYETGALRVALGGARWLSLLSLGWLLHRRPRSLLDNTPLMDTLHRAVHLPAIEQALASGDLQALAVTASSYSSGLHWTFCQVGAAQGFQPWQRPGRRSVLQPITIEHLAASAAIPFVFPAIPLLADGAKQFFGDGSMRQTSPLSPAVHLGAERVLVIGVGRSQAAAMQGASLAAGGVTPGTSASYPGLAQVAGHAMASIFHDTLDADVEQARRLSEGLERLPPEARSALGLRPLPVLHVQPSESIDALATQHLAAMPAPLRRLLQGLGGGASLSSYLLFEPPFVQALMALGERDAWARKDELAGFFRAAPTA